MSSTTVSRPGAGSDTGWSARLPGGANGRRFLLIQLIDRIGTGLWVSSSALWFTFVIGLGARQLGLMLGIAGAVATCSSPLVGRLGDRLPLRVLYLGAFGIRAVCGVLILVIHQYWALIVVVSLATFAERCNPLLGKLFAARAVGVDRARFQAWSRTAANAGYSLGAVLASIGISVGTVTAYRWLIVGDIASYLVSATLLLGLANPAAGAAAPREESSAGRPSPWRDRRYLAFTATELLLFCDASLLNIGIPLWLITATKAPHQAAALLYLLNTALVVLFQVRISPLGATLRRAANTLWGVAGCYLLAVTGAALAPYGGPVWAVVLLTVSVLGITGAEMLHAISSWELSISLAPPESQGWYLGVHGTTQSMERAVGPVLVTGVVLAGGPAGWALAGAVTAGVALAQRAIVLRHPALRSS